MRRCLFSFHSQACLEHLAHLSASKAPYLRVPHCLISALLDRSLALSHLALRFLRVFRFLGHPVRALDLSTISQVFLSFSISRRVSCTSEIRSLLFHFTRSPRPPCSYCFLLPSLSCPVANPRAPTPFARF